MLDLLEQRKVEGKYLAKARDTSVARVANATMWPSMLMNNGEGLVDYCLLRRLNMTTLVYSLLVLQIRRRIYYCEDCGIREASAAAELE